jgi:peptidyl-prolyl cis-trans isomerase A (cyclophilin A)
MTNRFLRSAAAVVLFAGIIGGLAPAMAEDSVDVIMSTAHGDIRISLDLENAPLSAANFLRYVDGEHYDGATFYRTVRYDNDNGNPKIEVIQGGIRDGDAPFEPINHEDTGQTGILHTDGVISMARDVVGTASSEFFICIGDQPGLDKGEVRNADEQGFAAFGKVVAGMDVVRKIHASPSSAPGYSEYVAGQIIEQPVLIERVRRASSP